MYSVVHWLMCVINTRGVLEVYAINLNVFPSLAQFFNLARTLHEHMDDLESTSSTTSAFIVVLNLL